MEMSSKVRLLKILKEKSSWVRKETLRIHKIAPETRLASSLSPIEIFTVLFYGNIVKCKPKNTSWEGRDRFIISKGHGAISFYPVLADLGFFSKRNLKMVCKEGCMLGGIPDSVIPGFETINGSLGHGLGVACGIALALKEKKRKEYIFVLMGDGELNEGSVWEAVMFAAEHKLDNLVLIIDNNKVSMLDFSRNIIDLSPISRKLRSFKWEVKNVDGHDVEAVYNALKYFKEKSGSMPKVLVADTVKGKGVPRLEIDPLSHIKNLKPEEAEALIADLE
jgi:transketolase